MHYPGSTRWLALGTLLLAIGSAGAAPADPVAPVGEDAARAQAQALYDQHNMVAALPLYERLSEQHLDSALYAERLALCLHSRYVNLPPGDERTATIARIKQIAERARSLGDTSNLLDSLLRTVDAASGTDAPPGGAILDAAEAAFARGDIDAALKAYIEAADAHPDSYEARLFAGDMYFRKSDAPHAGEWFQKAIDVDANRETAYRYWGDALMQAGDREAALGKFIDGVVAEPYRREAWMGLSQWAKATGATLGRTPIRLPPGPKSDGTKPGTTIAVDAEQLKHPEIGAAWLAYSVSRAAWQENGFAKAFPAETAYRHSLPEEVESLRLMLTIMQDPARKLSDYDESQRTVAALATDGMLESFVLISVPDEGIAHDYAPYRNEHRATVHAYIQKYVVHRDAARH